jgi:hypothetical protein
MLGRNLKNLTESLSNRNPAARRGRGSGIFTPTFPRPANLKDPTPDELSAYLKSEIAIAEAINAQKQVENIQKTVLTPDVCEYIEGNCIDTDSVSTKTWNYATAKGIKMISHQKRIMRHVLTIDPATGAFPYRTVVYSAPKKSAKTASTAFAGCWFAEYIEPPNIILVAANTQGQAVGRIFEAMAITLKYHGAEYKKSDKQIILKNGTVVQAITNDPESEAGASYGLVLISELWGWDGDRAKTLWAETMPVPTRLNSIRWVESYVGYEDSSELMLTLWKKVFKDTTQTELADGAEIIPQLADITTTDTRGNEIPCCYRVPKENMFVYIDHEHRFDWQKGERGEKYFREISVGLSDADIMRLVHNRWQLTENPLIKPENIKAAFGRGKDLTADGTSLIQGFPAHVAASKKMTFAIDASMGRNDTTAIAGVYSLKDETVAPLEIDGAGGAGSADDDDGDEIIAGRILTNVRFRCGYFKAYEPTGKKGERIDFDLDVLVGDEIVRLWKAGFIKRRDPDAMEKKLIEANPFLIPIAVYYDNYQMMQTATNLRKNHRLMIKELKQKTERVIADTLLQKVFKTGQIDTPFDPILEKHLTAAKSQSASKKGEQVSKIRIIKPETATQAIDGTVALSMAVYAESRNPPEQRRTFGSLGMGKIKS